MISLTTKILLKERQILNLEIPENIKLKNGEYEIVLVINPNSFSDEQNNETTEDEENEFQKLLMTAPTWSDEEYQNYIENKKLFSKWTIE